MIFRQHLQVNRQQENQIYERYSLTGWESTNKRKQELERVLSNVNMILQIEENKFKIQIEF